MENLNYKKNKIEYEIDYLKKEKDNYLDNVEKNKVSKKNMIINPILPVVGGIIGCGIYTIVCKTLPSMEFIQLMGISVLALECIGFEEEIEQITNYQDSKKVLEKNNLEELEKEISEKQKEKNKLLEERKNALVDNYTFGNSDPIFETVNLYLDNTMHFLPETNEKVLVKKRNEGSKG